MLEQLLSNIRREARPPFLGPRSELFASFQQTNPDNLQPFINQLLDTPYAYVQCAVIADILEGAEGTEPNLEAGALLFSTLLHHYHSPEYLTESGPLIEEQMNKRFNFYRALPYISRLPSNMLQQILCEFLGSVDISSEFIQSRSFHIYIKNLYNKLGYEDKVSLAQDIPHVLSCLDIDINELNGDRNSFSLSMDYWKAVIAGKNGTN